MFRLRDPPIELQAQQSDGQIRIFTVIDISETSITVDANHPLVGKDLTFEPELGETSIEGSNVKDNKLL